jgi:uncharacterized membrane protein YphA (DoxX/SURF4 family)
VIKGTERWISTAARVGVGAVFLVSGLTKVVDIDGTVRAVRAYQLLPESLVPSVGTALPVVEIALAVLLLTGLLTRFAALVTVPLSVAFIVGVSSAWGRGLKIHCGCFGNDGANAHPVPGYLREIVLNVVIIIACGWLIRRPGSRWSLDSGLGLEIDDDAFDDDPEPSIGVQQ